MYHKMAIIEVYVYFIIFIWHIVIRFQESRLLQINIHLLNIGFWWGWGRYGSFKGDNGGIIGTSK